MGLHIALALHTTHVCTTKTDAVTDMFFKNATKMFKDVTKLLKYVTKPLKHIAKLLKHVTTKAFTSSMAMYM